MAKALGEPILTLTHVRKVYGGGHTAVTALHESSLSVRPGEVAMIVGPSGSGKTTLLSIAGLLLSPSDGKVLLRGTDTGRLRQSDLARLRLRHIGFVFQSFNLLSALTARENVQLVMEFAGRRKVEASQRAMALLDELGLIERSRHYPNQLSGGEKQRVALARALANEPDLILADEPTANLDSKTGHVVVELLQDIAKRRSKSVLIVSHDMRIMDIADQVMRLEDGHLRQGFESIVKDPVCGMEIPSEEVVARLTYRGNEYGFCSRVCKETFQEHPEEYIDAENV